MAEDLRVQPDEGGEVGWGRGTGGDRGRRARGAEVAAEGFGVAGRGESEPGVETLAFLCGVERHLCAACLGEGVPHQVQAESLPGVPLGDQDHADHGVRGAAWGVGAERGEGAGSDEGCGVGLRVVDAVAGTGGER